jgi:hypothetical protein
MALLLLRSGRLLFGDEVNMYDAMHSPSNSSNDLQAGGSHFAPGTAGNSNGRTGRHGRSVDVAAEIQRLMQDRARHAAAMAEIDGVLAKVMAALGPSEARDPAAVSKSTTSSTRRRGQFARTADESVREFIRQEGDPTTKEINQHWRAEGRRGHANVTILKLLRAGLIRRVVDSTVRGSRYVVAEPGAKRVNAPKKDAVRVAGS